MNKRAFPLVAFLSLVLLADGVLAAPKGGQQFYRYKNKDGILVMERSIPPEYVAKGYQVVTITGQVIEDVPPAEVVDAATARQHSEDAARNVKLDNQLRKLYGSPADAVRRRNTQLDGLKVKLDVARGQVLQLNGKRKIEVDNAARLERSGKKVSDQVRVNIESYDRRIAEQEAQIKLVEQEQQKIRAEFSEIIARLNTIYPDKALPNEVNPPEAAAAPAATPAAAAPAKPAPGK